MKKIICIKAMVCNYISWSAIWNSMSSNDLCLLVPAWKVTLLRLIIYEVFVNMVRLFPG